MFCFKFIRMVLCFYLLMEILVCAEKNLQVVVSVLPLIRDHFFVLKKQLITMFQAMELLMCLKERYEFFFFFFF